MRTREGGSRQGWVKTQERDCRTRRWRGLRTRLLNADDPSSKRLTMTVVRLRANARLPAIKHDRTHEWVYVIHGAGWALLNGKKVKLVPGDYLYLPPGVWHAFSAGPRGVSALSAYAPGFDWESPDVRIREPVVRSRRRKPDEDK
ncbi:MAG: cupin domain-containing protein [Elusimicrobiota bacterium]